MKTWSMAKSGPPPGSAAAVCQEAFDSMSEEEKEFLCETAAWIKCLFQSGEKDQAKAHWDGLRLDADEQQAIWSLFGSKLRSFLKGKL